MNLFLDDPTEPDDLPRSAEEEHAEAASEINERSVRACVICGKPSPNSAECDACQDREWRRWER